MYFSGVAPPLRSYIANVPFNLNVYATQRGQMLHAAQRDLRGFCGREQGPAGDAAMGA